MPRETTTRSTSRKPHGWRVLALVSALSLALAGLVGLGLAPAASAAPPDQCPADADGVVWELHGTMCIGRSTAPSEIATTTWACPAGFSTDDKPVTETSKCSKDVPVDPVETFRCPEGYSPDGLVDQGTTCTRPGFLVFGKCIPLIQLSEYSAEEAKLFGPCTLTASTVHAGWTCPKAVDLDCVDPKPCPPVTVYADPEPTYTYQCPAGYWPARHGATSEADLETSRPIGPDTTCIKFFKEQATCPAGQVLEEVTDVPSVAPVRHQRPVTNLNCVTPVVPLVPTISTVPGGPTPVKDFCPNLDGVQWENYDCNTPQAVAAAEVVAPAPAVVSPAEITAPEAATVPVTAPEAATVEPPAKATVPQAVPAGGGSQAPTTPIWAYALLAVGVLGLAVAGRQLVGDHE